MIRLVLILCLLAGPAHAGPLAPVVTAIGAAFSAIAATTVGAFLLNTALSIGLSWGISKLRGKPKTPTPRTQSIIVRHEQVGDATPRSFIIGYRATAGFRNGPLYVHDLPGDEDKANRRGTRVTCLSCLPITAVWSVVINGERHMVADMVDWYVLRDGGDGANLVRGEVSTMTGDTLTVEGDPGWSVDQFAGHEILIERQWGNSQTRTIASNTADTITVTEDWGWTMSRTPDTDRDGRWWPRFTIYDETDPDVSGIWYGLTPATGKYAERIGFIFHLGVQTEADQFMLDTYGDYPERPWTSDMVGHGIAYAVVNIYWHPTERELWKGREPEVIYEIGGLATMIDPRSASAGYSDNPAVLAYNIAAGIELGGGYRWGGVWRDGGSVDNTVFDLPSWQAVANEADELVEIDGEMQPRMQAGLEVYLDQAPLDVLTDLFDSSGLKMAMDLGQLTLRGPTLSAPVASFTDDDLLVEVGDSSARFPAPNERINGVEVQYPRWWFMWRDSSTPEWVDEDARARDGRPLTLRLNAPAIWREWQANDLAAWVGQDAQRYGSHIVGVPWSNAEVRLGETVEWTSDRHQYDAVDMEIVSVTRDPKTGNVGWTLRPVSASDRDWQPGYADRTPVPVL